MIGRIDFTLDDKNLYRAVWALMQATSPAGTAIFLDQVYLRWIKERVLGRFQAEGDDVSGPWEPLAEATVATYRPNQGFSPSPINVRTGAMRAWATESDARFFFKGNTVSMRYPGNVPRGELRKKVLTAQAGRPKGVTGPKTPPRPILGFGPLDLATAVRQYSHWITDFMRSPMDLGAGAGVV